MTQETMDGIYCGFSMVLPGGAGVWGVMLAGGGCSRYPEYSQPPLVVDSEFNQSDVNRGRNTRRSSPAHTVSRYDQRGQAAQSQRLYDDRAADYPAASTDMRRSASPESQKVSVYYILDPSNPNADERGYVRVTDTSRENPVERQGNADSVMAWDRQQRQNRQPSSYDQQGGTPGQMSQRDERNRNYNNSGYDTYGQNNQYDNRGSSRQVSDRSRSQYSGQNSSSWNSNQNYQQVPAVPSVSVDQGGGSGYQTGSTVGSAREHNRLTTSKAPGFTPSPEVPAVNIQQTVPEVVVQTNQVGLQPRVVSIEGTISDLEQLLMKKPENIQTQMALRLLYQAMGDQDKAMQSLEFLPVDNQVETMNLVQAMLLSTQARQKKDNFLLANRALDALGELSDEVSSSADLMISCMKICSDRAEGFGQYNVLPAEKLSTGKPQRVWVYCELQNFRNHVNAEGKFFARLRADITLYDASLTPLAKLSDDVEDTPSFSKRRDFFLRGPLDVPSLAPGKYEIVVSMEDKVAGRRAIPVRYAFEVKGN